MITQSARLRTVVAAIALSALALLTGCSSSSGGMSQSSTDSAGPWPLPAAEMGDMAGMHHAESALGMPDASVQAVIQTGYLSIRVEDPQEAVDGASEITRSLGGRVESRQISSHQFTPERQAPTSAHMTLRIPDASLDEAYEALSALGTVRSDQRDAQDVTMQKVDLEAQVDSLARSIERLEALVTDAGDLSDLIELENALADRRARLDSLSAQLDYLSDQVSFSTISVEFVSVEASADPAPETFWSAFLAGIKSIGTALSSIVVGLGLVLPWVVVLGVITVVIVVVTRAVSRRRKTE